MKNLSVIPLSSQTPARKVSIVFPFKDGPWGGANQFLKSLREEFRRTGKYTDYWRRADFLLFNSHHCLRNVIVARLLRPGLTIVHRLAGPMSATRDNASLEDAKIYLINRWVADGAIFQSNWSRQKNLESGFPAKQNNVVITNAPDPSIFFPKGFSAPKMKCRIITTNWSGNLKKGFAYYKYLDEHLDFSKFDLTLVGNSPVAFQNIQVKQPVPSKELAEIMRDYDVFISAAQNEACSNSIVEAMHCGLEVYALDSGSNREVVGERGVVFKDAEQLLRLLEARQETRRSESPPLKGIDCVAQSYLDACNDFHSSRTVKPFRRIRGILRLLPLVVGLSVLKVRYICQTRFYRFIKNY